MSYHHQTPEEKKYRKQEFIEREKNLIGYKLGGKINRRGNFQQTNNIENKNLIQTVVKSFKCYVKYY